MVQVGTKSLPIRIVPRIDGAVVTQDDIKNIYSNFYVDDPTTPLSFTLEYKEVGQALQTPVAFDAGLSTASSIYFTVPDSFYTDRKEWTVSVYWTIGTERIYIIKTIKVSVKDEHNR